MAGKKVLITTYLTPQQHARLHAIADASRVPFSTIAREAIDLVLDKHEAQAEAQPTRCPCCGGPIRWEENS